MDGFLLCWYLLTALSVGYLIWDQLVNTPSMWVMGLAWGLVMLYTGPIGLFFYLISCRQPMPGTHDQFIDVHWKQALGSEIHCVAGDATAIIIAAAVLHYFPLPNGLEAIVEYAAAYLFGLFIFQALFMRSMFSTYGEAVRHTIFVETVSMNMVMLGMIPTVLVIKALFPIASNPELPYFWGMMSLATLLGFITGYPINSWLVKRGVKHGMMSRGMEHHHMEPAKLPRGLAIWTLIWTSGLLVLAIWICSLFVNVEFCPG
jgi:Domain of unknown function (DUF4396)